MIYFIRARAQNTVFGVVFFALSFIFFSALFPITANAAEELVPAVNNRSMILQDGSQIKLWDGASWTMTPPSPIALDVSDDRNQLCVVSTFWTSVACRKTQQPAAFQTVFQVPVGTGINDVAVGASNAIVAKLTNGEIWARQSGGQFVREIASPNPAQPANGILQAIEDDYCLALEQNQTTVTVTCRTIGVAGAPTFTTTVNGNLQDFDMAKDTVFLLVRDPATGRTTKHQWTVSTGQPFVMPVGVTPNFSEAVVSPDGFTFAWDTLNAVTQRFEITTWDVRTSNTAIRLQLREPVVLGYDTVGNLWIAPPLLRWLALPPQAPVPAGWNGPIQLP